MKHFPIRRLIITFLGLLATFALSSFAFSAQIQLAWDPNTEWNLAGYKVYYGITKGAYWIPIDVGNPINGSSVTYTLTGLTKGQTYFIAVTAYDTSSDESGYSNEVNGVAATVAQKTPFNDTTEFVKQQYRDFLNRESDANGLRYWVNMIDSGTMTKAQVIDSFLKSLEYEREAPSIVRLYFAYFFRIPDYGRIQYWITEYIDGWSLESISNAFAASSEFQQTYGNLNNEQFVTMVYQNVLFRSPDSEGYAYWVDQLKSGAVTRAHVMLEFSKSVEYTRLISNEVFMTLLHMDMFRRSPDPGGLDYWVGCLDSGYPELFIIDEFLNSLEYDRRFQ